MEPEVAVVPSPAKSQSLPGLWVLACYWKTFESTVAKSHPTPGCPDTAGRRALADGIYRCVPWSWKQGRVWCPGGPPLECLAQKPGGLMHLCISLFVELDIVSCPSSLTPVVLGICCCCFYNCLILFTFCVLFSCTISEVRRGRLQSISFLMTDPWTNTALSTVGADW